MQNLLLVYNINELYLSEITLITFKSKDKLLAEIRIKRDDNNFILCHFINDGGKNRSLINLTGIKSKAGKNELSISVDEENAKIVINSINGWSINRLYSWSYLIEDLECILNDTDNNFWEIKQDLSDCPDWFRK